MSTFLLIFYFDIIIFFSVDGCFGFNTLTGILYLCPYMYVNFCEYVNIFCFKYN